MSNSGSKRDARAVISRRGALWSGAGLVAIAALGVDLVRPAVADASEFQSNWRWCRRCQAMFYAGMGGHVCVLGGPHDPTGSGNYILGTAPSSPGQDNWRWCRQCQGLFYGGASAGMGRCPAGGGSHTNAGSGNYHIETSPTAIGQHGWRWCNRCQGMFYGNGGAAPCPAGGMHDSRGSGDYAISSID